jgi:hypothetical protein
MTAFLSSLLSELKVQHSLDAIVIECDRATMPVHSLRERTRLSTNRPSTSSTTRPSHGRSASSSATNIRSQSLDEINLTQTTKLPIIDDDSKIIVLSPSPSSPTKNKMGGIWQPGQKSPCSVLCVNGLPTMSPRSIRWCPSRPTLDLHESDFALTCQSDSALTCPKRRPGSLDL